MVQIPINGPDSCCCSCCCSPCCCLPFQFGALRTSSTRTPYILGPEGQLVREGETRTEGNREKEEIKESKIDIEENKDEEEEAAFEIDE